MTTKASLIDLNGNEMILDADGDTKIDAATDDEIHFTVAGSETVYMGVTSYNASDRIVLSNTGGNASATIVGSTSGESSIFMADGTSGDASYRGYVQYQHTNDNMNFGTAGSEAMRIDSSGNVLIGTTSGSTHFIKKAVSVGSTVLEVTGNNLGTKFFNADGGSPNSASSAMDVFSVGATGRSINASGTVNTGGNDYAEYMKKTDSCGTIAKGDVCGVDSNGKLTDVFADAMSFVIKSTNPSYVGGDNWGGTELNLTEEQYEAERQKYDRIAFSGQVPVNITGSFNVGDYIYPQASGTNIEAVAKANPTFEEYQLCVGKIWSTEDDGRPLVAVKIG